MLELLASANVRAFSEWQYQLKGDTQPQVICACTKQQAILTIAEFHPGAEIIRVSKRDEWSE